MDKYATAKALKNLEKEGIFSMRQYSQSTSELLSFPLEGLVSIWKTIVTHTQSKSVIVKPQSDGCSSEYYDFPQQKIWFAMSIFFKAKASTIPPHTFPHQGTEIEMPNEIPKNLLFEPFIETDSLRISGHILKRKKKPVDWSHNRSSWKGWRLSRAFAKHYRCRRSRPFQKRNFRRNRVNITPPPKEIVPKDALQKKRKSVLKSCSNIRIQGYVRIDAFLECATAISLLLKEFASCTHSFNSSSIKDSQKYLLFPISVVETIIKNSGYEIWETKNVEKSLKMRYDSD